MAADAAPPTQSNAAAADGAPPAAAFFIIGTIAIDAMGIGLILPVMPELLRDVAGVGVS